MAGNFSFHRQDIPMTTTATKIRRKAAPRVRAAARPVRTVTRRVKRQAVPFLETETGKLIAWGAAGFAGVLAVAGIAAVLVENGTLELPDRRELEGHLKAIQNSKTPREAMAWLSSQVADLRSELNTQMARLS
jgi:hypothetical protein